MERFARRLRGIAMILRGSSRGDTARAGRGQTDGRDWVTHFNDAEPDGLRDLRCVGGTHPCCAE